MTFIYSDKLEKMIAEYNINILNGDMQETVSKLTRRICLHMAMHSLRNIEGQAQELREHLENRNFWMLFIQWLNNENIYTVSFDNMYLTCFTTGIRKAVGSTDEYSGFAYFLGGKFYIFVQYRVSINSTVSILVHEIMHVELEAIFHRYEADAGIVLSEDLKEEIVIFSEHCALRKVLGLALDDLSEENLFKYEGFALLAEKGILPAIYQWIEQERKGELP